MTKAKAKYGWHKRTAGKRGIQFLLSFDEWYNWWLSNGIDKNLPTVPFNANTLCMCRFNDIGPYALTNIYCATVSQNVKDQNLKQLPPNTSKPIHTPLGIFNSRIEAAKTYNLDPAAINYRLNKYPNDFYYL